jgi:hypothetical protein
VNLRGVAGTPKEQHTKAIALCVSAYARLAREPGGDRFRAGLPGLVGLLETKAVPRGDASAWAYEFHMQTRWGEYRAGKPNAVATAFAGHALMDAMDLDGNPSREELARRGVAYACRELVIEKNGERFFAYYEGKDTPIHNASVMLAALAGRCSDPDSEERRVAADAIAYTISRQRPDGSWPYGEGKRLGWVDGFHTAYVLESLRQWYELTGDESARRALDRGLDLYLVALVDPDGAARATLRNRYPIDIHAVATAISALALLESYDERAFPTATRVLGWTLASLQRADGRFAFQQHRTWRNPTPYIRWGDAHMLLALATYCKQALIKQAAPGAG